MPSGGWEDVDSVTPYQNELIEFMSIDGSWYVTRGTIKSFTVSS